MADFFESIGIRLYCDSKQMTAGAAQMDVAGRRIEDRFRSITAEANRTANAITNAMGRANRSVSSFSTTVRTAGTDARNASAHFRAFGSSINQAFTQASHGASKFYSAMMSSLRSVITYGGLATAVVGRLGYAGLNAGYQYNSAIDLGRQGIASFTGDAYASNAMRGIYRYGLLTPFQTPMMMPAARIASVAQLYGQGPSYFMGQEIPAGVAAYVARAGYRASVRDFSEAEMTRAMTMPMYLAAGGYGQARRLGRRYGITDPLWERFGAKVVKSGTGSTFANTPQEMLDVLARMDEQYFKPYMERISYSTPGRVSTLKELFPAMASEFTAGAYGRAGGQQGYLTSWIQSMTDMMGSKGFQQMVSEFDKLAKEMTDKASSEINDLVKYVGSGKFNKDMHELGTTLKDLFGPSMKQMADAAHSVDWANLGKQVAEFLSVLAKGAAWLSQHNWAMYALLANRLGAWQMAGAAMGLGRAGFNLVRGIGASVAGGGAAAVAGGGAAAAAGGGAAAAGGGAAAAGGWLAGFGRSVFGAFTPTSMYQNRAVWTLGGNAGGGYFDPFSVRGRQVYFPGQLRGGVYNTTPINMWGQPAMSAGWRNVMEFRPFSPVPGFTPLRAIGSGASAAITAYDIAMQYRGGSRGDFFSHPYRDEKGAWVFPEFSQRNPWGSIARDTAGGAAVGTPGGPIGMAGGALAFGGSSAVARVMGAERYLRSAKGAVVGSAEQMAQVDRLRQAWAQGNWGIGWGNRIFDQSGMFPEGMTPGATRFREWAQQNMGIKFSSKMPGGSWTDASGQKHFFGKDYGSSEVWNLFLRSMAGSEHRQDILAAQKAAQYAQGTSGAVAAADREVASKHKQYGLTRVAGSGAQGYQTTLNLNLNVNDREEMMKVVGDALDELGVYDGK